MHESEPSDREAPATLPFSRTKNKPGRKTNAERARLALAAPPAETRPDEPLTRWLPPEAADPDTLARLEAMPERLRGRQLKLDVAVDLTVSTEPYDGDMRGGAGGVSAELAGNAMARAATNVFLLGFSTDCQLMSLTRGGFELPPKLEYRTGTYLRPVLDRTAASAKAFAEHVVKSGATQFQGITILVSDFQFHDREAALPCAPAWREYLRRHGQLVVSAMLGQPDREAAAALSGPVPPVAVDRLSIKALFKLLADTLKSSLGGATLEAELKKQLGQHQ